MRRATAAGDRRRSVLSLTERGWSVYRRIVPLALAYERRLLAELSPDEQAHPRRCSRGCSSGPGVSVPLATRVYNPRRHATAKRHLTPAC